ncbi:MAG: carbohydrate ABC transporter permease [Cryobacterium sp.]|nr:carbohydrate ABC transporter permease [Cryobacterium sp.]
MLFPFIWALSTSLKEAKDVFDPSGGVIPDPISFDAYVNVFTKIAFSQYFLNSVIVTVLIVGLNVLFDTLAAYAFAKLKFPGRDVIFGALLITLMIPSQVNLIPLYRFMVWLHQVFPFLGVDTLSGIVMPTMVQVFGIFLLRQFFASIPDSVVEAARLDGAGEWRILWRMIFPIAAPAIATLVIFTFLSAWNDFLWPLLISNSEASRTLPVGLTLLSRKNTVNWPETMAGSVVTIVPMIIVFLVLQRRFIEGIAAGVTK